MNKPPRQYWFPAKRHGWGWGAPAVWQGWAVLGGFLAAIWLITSLVPRSDPALSWALVLLATAAFAVIVWRKGEPPGWHSGE